MHLMDFLGIFPFGLYWLLHSAKPIHIIIHSLPSGDKRETWEQSKLPQSISCREDPSRSRRRVMDGLKPLPGLTAMSSVNVNHWFPLRAPVTFPFQSKALNSLLLPFLPFFYRHTGSQKILSCVSYLSIRNGRGERGGEREGGGL